MRALLQEVGKHLCVEPLLIYSLLPRRRTLRSGEVVGDAELGKKLSEVLSEAVISYMDLQASDSSRAHRTVGSEFVDALGCESGGPLLGFLPI